MDQIPLDCMIQHSPSICKKKRGSVAARLRGEAETYCNKSNKRARLIMINEGVNYNEEYKCE